MSESVEGKDSILLSELYSFDTFMGHCDRSDDSHGKQIDPLGGSLWKQANFSRSIVLN